MNKLFLDNISEEIERCLNIHCDLCDQEFIKDLLVSNKITSMYPMISYESTNDSDIEVTPDESRFLNDESYKDNWIVVYNDDAEDICLIQLTDHNTKTIELSVFEMCDQKRVFGYARDILDFFEWFLFNFYEEIVISPFDTDAMNFWSHRGYINNNNGLYIKQREDED